MQRQEALLNLAFLAVAVTLSPSSALAHHSGAMFDQEHKITLSGTVRVFEWTNPHAYIQLRVSDEKGHDEEWSLEMAAPIYLQQLGWRPNSVKTGDRMTVTIAPLRNMRKRKGGLIYTASDSAGKPIGKPMATKP